MRFRLNSLVLILGTLVPILGTAQEQVMRFRPPFAGLVQNLNQTDIPDNAFFILSNAALTSSGEIYKRGAFETVHSITGATENALKIDKLTLSIGIGSLYRYRTASGLRRLLATAMGAKYSTDSLRFAHWYWLNDTTGRFAYTVAAADTVDTMSQLDYRVGRVSVRQNATHSSVFVIGDSSTFFLNASNLSELQVRSALSCNSGFTGDDAGVYVVNDTLLAFERDSMCDMPAALDTFTLRKYEVRYRTAHNQTSSPSMFYAEAMTYLDTVYFSRGMFDPIKWDGSRTSRANIVEYGTATSIVDSTLTDAGKVWTPNQWAGFWLFRRNISHLETPANGLWRTNWAKIKSNTATTLTLDSTTVVLDSTTGVANDRTYAIVSMPIDEVVSTIVNLSPQTPTPAGSFSLAGNPLSSFRTVKQIFSSPWQAFILDGESAGQLWQIRRVAGSSILITRGGGNLRYPDRVQFLRSRFPITKFVRNFKDRILWISDTTFQNTVWWSEVSNPGYIQPNSFFVINPIDGEYIQACWIDNDIVYFAKDSKIYALLSRSFESSGTTPGDWQIVEVSDKIGCEAPRSVVQRAGKTWFFDWPGGFYEMAGGQFKKISDPIRPLIDSITVSFRDRVWGVYYPSKKGDFILWGVPLTEPQGAIGDSLKPIRVLAYSMETGAWSTWKMDNPVAVKASVGMVAEGAGDGGEMYLGLADSAYLLKYFPDKSIDTLNGQGASPSATTFSLIAESKRFGLPGQQIRFSEMEPIVNVGGTATLTFNFYKNLSTISVASLAPSLSSGWQNFRKSLSDAVIGNQLAWRITTSSAQSFRLGGLDITVLPAGRRLPE